MKHASPGGQWHQTGHDACSPAKATRFAHQEGYGGFAWGRMNSRVSCLGGSSSASYLNKEVGRKHRGNDPRGLRGPQGASHRAFYHPITHPSPIQHSSSTHPALIQHLSRTHPELIQSSNIAKKLRINWQKGAISHHQHRTLTTLPDIWWMEWMQEWLKRHCRARDQLSIRFRK